MWRGLPYLGLVRRPGIVGLEGSETAVALALAAILGAAKGLTVLRRAGRHAVERMAADGDRAPVWTVFPLRVVALIGFFVVLGMALRLAPYPDVAKAWVVGTLYPGIGLALCIGGIAILRAPSVPPHEALG